MNSLLKPNILGLAVLSVALVAILAFTATPESEVSVTNIACVVAGGFVAVMFALSAPAPNPDVDAAFASDVIAMAAGAGNANKAAESLVTRETKALICLIFLAALLSAFALLWPGIPDSIGGNLTSATIGMIGGTVGKMVDPPPDKMVPQSVVFEALKRIAEINAKAGK